MAATFTIEDARSANIQVIEDEEKGNQAVHDLITAMRANRRSGTANTKTRGEVAWTGKKPWRQKGTGRARAGGNAPPHWKGGGIVFGPRPRDYSKKVTKNTRKLAFKKALSSRIMGGDVIFVDSFEVPEGKTKSFVEKLRSIAPNVNKVIIIAAAFSEETSRAEYNFPHSRLMTADELNVEHLLFFDKLVLTQSALEILKRRTS